MINNILLISAIGIGSIAMFLLIKYGITFFRLVKERDGYYLIKGIF